MATDEIKSYSEIEKSPSLSIKYCKKLGTLCTISVFFQAEGLVKVGGRGDNCCCRFYRLVQQVCNKWVEVNNVSLCLTWFNFQKVKTESWMSVGLVPTCAWCCILWGLQMKVILLAKSGIFIWMQKLKCSLLCSVSF